MTSILGKYTITPDPNTFAALVVDYSDRYKTSPLRKITLTMGPQSIDHCLTPGYPAQKTIDEIVNFIAWNALIAPKAQSDRVQLCDTPDTPVKTPICIIDVHVFDSNNAVKIGGQFHLTTLN